MPVHMDALISDLPVEVVAAPGHNLGAQRTQVLLVVRKRCRCQTLVLMLRDCTQRLHVGKFIFRHPPHPGEADIVVILIRNDGGVLVSCMGCGRDRCTEHVLVELVRADAAVFHRRLPVGKLTVLRLVKSVPKTLGDLQWVVVLRIRKNDTPPEADNQASRS